MGRKRVRCRLCDSVMSEGYSPHHAETEYSECGQCHVNGPPVSAEAPKPDAACAPPLILTRAQLHAYRDAGVIEEREGGPTFGGVSIQVSEDIRAS